jgi:cell division protein ZipA
MDEFRWILLILGLLVVAGVYGFTRWQDSRRRGSRRRGREAFQDDADIDSALHELDAVVAERDPLAQPSERSAPAADDDWDIRPIEREPVEPEPLHVEAEEEPLPPAGEIKVIVLNVAATNGRHFSGEQLVDALHMVGMRLGEHDIYHRLLETRGGEVSLFSAANILKPGTLRPEELEQIQSPGVAMFLQLPGPYDGLVAFEQMLEAARRIGEALDVKLLDARRCTLSNQAIEAIREELREYRRRAHLAGKKTI